MLASMPGLPDIVPETALPAISGGRPIRSGASLIFGAPVIGEEEVEAVSECLRTRWIGMGPLVSRFEERFAGYKNIEHAVAVNSGSAALHLALVGLGIGPGDEVIVPTMTFCATVNAVIHAGATPVLADCCRDTFNLDVEEVARKITPRTRAIIVVHMCGACADMDSILSLSRNYGLYVIEDCAHAIESTYKGRAAGTMGDVGCFSFYATKNMTTGDGGMLLTADSELASRLKNLSLHGMDASAWTRQRAIGKLYGIVALGFKYNMTDIEAALGLVQLKSIEIRHERRRQIWAYYKEQLKDLPLQLPLEVPPHSRHGRHLFTILLDLDCLKVTRSQIAEALGHENIGTGVHYVPVHMQPYYKEAFGFEDDDFPNSAFVGMRTLSLPLSADLTEDDLDDVCHALRKVVTYYGRANAASIPRRKEQPDPSVTLA
jgi:dTDP-4-amino-4,6-dideoxygalactose transaminase